MINSDQSGLATGSFAQLADSLCLTLPAWSCQKRHSYSRCSSPLFLLESQRLQAGEITNGSTEFGQNPNRKYIFHVPASGLWRNVPSVGVEILAFVTSASTFSTTQFPTSFYFPILLGSPSQDKSPSPPSVLTAPRLPIHHRTSPIRHPETGATAFKPVTKR